MGVDHPRRDWEATHVRTNGCDNYAWSCEGGFVVANFYERNTYSCEPLASGEFLKGSGSFLAPVSSFIFHFVPGFITLQDHALYCTVHYIQPVLPAISK